MIEFENKNTSLFSNQPEIPSHHPLMEDLYEVGPDKPLGYLPLWAISEVCGEEVNTVRDLSEQRGLSTLLQNQKDSSVYSGALYVYDRVALQELLDTNRDILERNHWPADPLEFIERSGKETVDFKRQPDLYTLIAWAYRDPRPEFQRPGVSSEQSPVALKSKLLLKRLGSLILKR